MIATVAPANQNGFRMKTIEIRNFGGYHGSPARFCLDNEGVVFSGPNGAGKSTALDAMRLIFRERPSFNSASAETSSGRSIESYYVGQYASTGRGQRTSKKDAQTLRGIGDEKNPMGVLIVFENLKGENFTAGRLLFIRANGDRVWQNFTCPGELSLSEHFAEWKTSGKVARQMAELGGMLHKTMDDYLVALGEAFGFTNHGLALDAFRNFEAAIGVKDMKSVNGFAQDYLLPADNFAQAVDTAIQQVEDSYQAILSVEKTKKQIKMLHELKDRMESYNAANSGILQADDRLQLADLTRKIVDRFMQRSVLSTKRAELVDLTDRHATAEAEMTNLEAEKESLNAALNSDEARRAKELRAEQGANATKIGNRETRLARMSEIAEELLITLDSSTDVKWSQIGTKVATIATNAEAAAEDLRGQKSEHDFNLHQKKAEIEEINQEIKTLEDSGSNLHSHSLKARTAIAEAIGLAEEDMPFVCELVRIRKGEESWEGVANRVLDGVGRQMLVAPELYADAVTALNAGHWGGKVVICDTKRKYENSCANLPSDSLAAKLEVKDHRYADIVDSLLHDNADHRCVSAAQLKSVKGKAVTEAGTIKMPNRAEKNDKFNINDRRHYILAWDTRARKQGLEEARDALMAEHADLATVSQQFNVGIAKHAARFQSAQKLLGGHEGWPEFDQIETASLVARNKQIKSELSKLETGKTAKLFERQKAVLARIPVLRDEINELLVKKGSAEGAITSLTKSLKDTGDAAKAIMKNGARGNEKLFFGLEDRNLFRSIILEETAGGAIGTHFAHAPITALATKDYSSVERVWAGVQLKLRKARDQVGQNVSTAMRGMQSLAHRYLAQWPEEGTKLESGITSADGEAINYTVYEEWMAALTFKEDEGLPKFLQTLKEESSEFVEQHLTTIGSEIEAYDERVEEMIDSINALLINIPYDPAKNTRAALKFLESEDEEINAFRSRFKMISDNAHKRTRRELTEELRDLLSTLVDNSENKARRKKILSLAKWKDVYVEELGYDANGDLELLRSFMGKDGASGGQRERLTMLMLGAAQSYGMGGADLSRTATGLQTIVLDEAFLRSSSETAQASTDILIAMGLQVIAATPFEKVGALQGQVAQVITVTSKSNQVITQPMTYEQLLGAITPQAMPHTTEEEVDA